MPFTSEMPWHPPGLVRRAALGLEAAEGGAFEAGGNRGFEAGDAEDLGAGDEGEAARVSDADAQAGEAAGAGDDADAGQLGKGDAGFCAEFGDEARQAPLLAARHRLATVTQDFPVPDEGGFHRAEGGVEA